MRKIFKVELSGEGNLYTELVLPATPYAMLDALERVRAEEGKLPRWDILDTYECGDIVPHLDFDGSLLELNALCQRLAALNEDEMVIAEGLVKASCTAPSDCIPMPQLINITYNTDHCHVVGEGLNDSQLGRFCAENGFVPGTETLSDNLFDLLDFERIGREHRQREGGTFVERTDEHGGGYVEPYDKPENVYMTLDLSLKAPDYAVLVETASGAQIKLPRPLDDPAGEEPVQCVDCAAPTLAGLTAMLGTWDMLAHRLSELTVDGELTKYKAVLDANQCDDPVQALALADELDQYTFSPQITDYEDVARERLAAGLSHEDVELILPRLNLYGFGKDLVEHSGGQLTSYGLIERGGMEQEQTTAQNGMELQ